MSVFNLLYRNSFELSSKFIIILPWHLQQEVDLLQCLPAIRHFECFSFIRGRHMHDHIASLRREVYTHNTSLTPPLCMKVPVPSQDKNKRSCISVLEVSILSLSMIFYWRHTYFSCFIIKFLCKHFNLYDNTEDDQDIQKIHFMGNYPIYFQHYLSMFVVDRIFTIKGNT